MPQQLEPMLAELAREVPSNEAAYAFELKWDGYRGLAFLDRGTLRMLTRRQRDYTQRLPELWPLAQSLPDRRLVLDGELVALLPGGRTSFGELHDLVGTWPRVPRPDRKAALAYLIFDLLYLDGRSLLRTPYRERRRQLEALELSGPAWWVPPSQEGGGRDLLETSRELGHEGVVAKRLDSPYRPGLRSREWLKIKQTRRQEFVIVGWMPALGYKRDRVGSLLLACYDVSRAEARRRRRRQQLIYAGKVGTGFSQKILDELTALLVPLHAGRSPLDVGVPPPIAEFVRPQLVCEVEFWEWAPGGETRHGSFRGLRTDKNARDVIREM